MEEEEKLQIIKKEATKPKSIKDKKQNEMKDNTNNNQDNNDIGNYGRIFIQEGDKKNLVYSEYDVPNASNSNQLRDQSNTSTIKYNKIDVNKNTSNKINSKNIRGTKEEKKASNIRRKSIGRGGKFNNVQVTYIINSGLDIDFHIIDPLVELTEESKKKYRGVLNKNNKNGKNGKVKVAYSCSCENVDIRPKEKKKNNGTVEVMPHRENPHLKRIDVNGINKSANDKSYSKVSKFKK
jgi:hypothetical protein